MQLQQEVDFEPLYEAKERFVKTIASRYEAKLLKLYFAHHEPQSSAIDASEMGKRALKNKVLKLLSSLGSNEVVDIAKQQYYQSQTMTDKIAALDVLEAMDEDASTEVFSDFYEHYKDNTLVMQKYFALLAASSREGVLQRVIALQDDAVFDFKVPNLVRSLIGVFARNYKYFHAKDGSGYEFIADKIIEIDKINAQMASGLAGSFKLYPKMNKTDKIVMKKALERIISQEDLSKNCYEIIHKILT
jgi:aminopeptidase N